MKILVITPFHPSPVGLLAECEATIGLKKRGLEVDVMTPHKSSSYHLYKKNGIDVIDFEPTKKFDFKAIFFIRKLIKDKGYDLLYLVRGKGITNGILASIGLPVKVVTYLGSTSFYWYDPTAYLTHLNPRVDKIVCISHDVKNHLQKQFVKKHKLVAIHKGFNINTLTNVTVFSKKELGLPDESFLVSCLGRSNRVKGIRYLIEAAQYLDKNSNIHIVIVGINSKLKDYQSLRNNSPARDRIHFFGFRPDAIRITATSDLYVQPSLNEGLGRAIMEAMGFGIAPIITDAGGCTELIENGKSGLIVPVKDPKAIADAITYLYNNPELKEKMGRNAKERIMNHFSIDNTADKLFNLFSELIKKN